MFDVESEFDIFFKTERRVAEARGEAKGKRENAVAVAKKMLKKNYEIEDIAECSGLSVDKVIEIKNELLQPV